MVYRITINFMKNIDKKNALELLSKVSNTVFDMIYENDVKVQIKQELDLVFNYIENLETDPVTILMNDIDVIVFNILKVEDLVDIFGSKLNESDQEILNDLIIKNSNLIELGNWQGIYEQVLYFMNMEFVFRDCPEIMEFINDKSIN
jgi:hypothetical protein